MSLTTEQKKGLHHCPGCGHLNQSHDGTGCVACNPYLDDHESCDRIPKLIETTYKNVEALLSETVAAMRAELDAAEAEVKQLRESIEELADRLERDSSAGARARWDSAYSAAYGDGYQDGASLGAEGLRRLLDGGAS